ncbi:MAG: hypothetical protein A2046_08400 [Bacteroidetes bacterium GWA2_30_7]|nr:MAG: hypothetical protein A2046_08400 [Bacteroidetes bacterium GWA2_30_7]
MKTKILLIASGVILTAGVALHSGNGCPFDKPCQKLFKSEKAVVSAKAEKCTVMKIETAMIAKK